MLKRSTSVLCLAALLAAACGGDDKPTNPGEGARGDAGGSAPDAAGPDSRAPRPDGSTGTRNDASVGGDAGGSGAGVGDAGGSDAGNAPAPDGGGPVVAPCDASKAPVLPALKLEEVPGAAGLDRLVFAAQAPASDDWYLVQQGGTIRVLSNGTLKPGNFLDISSQISLVDDKDERGLLGLAFAPDYATSGKLYVMMTPTKGANQNRDSLLEYTRDGDAVLPTPREILRLAASEVNHNGGNVVFDKNGLMFVGTGDGGGGGCNNNNEAGGSQDPGSLFGKILRLDLKNESGMFAAAGNPFQAPDGDPRVWHYGLRNPYRFQLDRANGDIYIGDVGQDNYEEVDFAAAGASGLNFGWPKFEGIHEGTCGNKELNPGSTATPPVIDIPRKTGLYSDYISVIMGAPYRGSAIPALQGVTLFGDYRGARYQAFVQCADKTSPVTVIARAKNPNQPDQAAFSLAPGAPAVASLVAIVQGNDNEIYLVANRNTLLKVVPGG
jgi:glucose/arabinose dehydrogenase